MNKDMIRRVVAAFQRKAGVLFDDYIKEANPEKAFQIAKANALALKHGPLPTGDIAEKNSFVMRAKPMPYKKAVSFAYRDDRENGVDDPAFCIPVIEYTDKLRQTNPIVVGHFFYGYARN